MSALTTTGRLIAGAVVTAAAVVIGIGAVLAPLPGHARDAVTVAAQPSATTSVATCAGPVLATARDSAQAALLSDAAAQAVTASEAAGSARRLAAPDVADGTGPASFRAAPTGDEPTDIAAAGSSALEADDLRGFAASACTRAAMESWLVGGAGTTGAADLVVLANPGDVAAQVTITVYGATGPVVPTAGDGIVVAAGTQRVIPLASLALGEESPVLRITAAEAPVQASLQASLTRVLTPGGVDQVGASVVPGSRIVIPGVPVTSAPGEAGDSNVPTLLRLLAPAAAATATVTVYRGGAVVGSPQTVPLLAGVPLQLDLAGLDIGLYTVVVEATAPVTGAVWATSGFGAGSDFGWFAAAGALTAASLVAVADGANPVLTLFSDGDAQTVTVRAESGSAIEVAVPAGGAATVPVEQGVVYRIEPADGAGPIRAAVTYGADGAIAGYPVAAGDAAAAGFTVYPR
ncbi:DUF5719 family protein [Microbacterium sp.]|uniref:DUF5719 family protein n=1 Tax=Microbacterium sp. TaxID=51671 RepID=UPI0039E4B080